MEMADLCKQIYRPRWSSSGPRKQLIPYKNTNDAFFTGGKKKWKGFESSRSYWNKKLIGLLWSGIRLSPHLPTSRMWFFLFVVIAATIAHEICRNISKMDQADTGPSPGFGTSRIRWINDWKTEWMRGHGQWSMIRTNVSETNSLPYCRA